MTAMILETTLFGCLFLFTANTQPAVGCAGMAVVEGSSCCCGAGDLVASAAQGCGLQGLGEDVGEHRRRASA